MPTPHLEITLIFGRCNNASLVIASTPAINVVDIGDSAGTHLKKISMLMDKGGGRKINGISVNLDPIAVDKINKNGGRAILCRAEVKNMLIFCCNIFLSSQAVTQTNTAFAQIRNRNNHIIPLISFCQSVDICLGRNKR